MRITSLFLLMILSGCAYDMASYVQLSDAPCSGEKNVIIEPNEDMDADVYEAASSWLRDYLVGRGYRFNHDKPNVWVTLGHDVTPGETEADEVGRVKEVYEGEGAPSSASLYHHLLQIHINDKRCPKDSLKVHVSLDTYSENTSDVLPELMASLKQSITNTGVPRAKTVHHISRRV